VDASARSLNIDKLAHTLDRNGDGKLFDWDGDRDCD
jgi:hypothetical protein